MKLDSIELPETLYWEDEQAWKPWIASTRRAVNGALDVQIQALSYGQPITLVNGFLTRAELAVIRALENDPTAIRTLTLNDGGSHAVIVDIAKGGVEAAPLFPNKNPDDSEPYRLTIHLLTVEPA